MKVLIHMIRGILAIVWVLLLAVNVRLYLDGRASEGQPPQLGGWVLWTMADGAMAPDYQENDLLLIDTSAQAQPGDPVLCRGEGGLAVSRIIGTSEGRLILKADGREDSLLAGPEAVAGVCTAYLPGCGPAAEFLHSAPGLAVVFITGLVLFLLPGVTMRTGRGRPRGRTERPGRVERQDRYTPRH